MPRHFWKSAYLVAAMFVAACQIDAHQGWNTNSHWDIGGRSSLRMRGYFKADSAGTHIIARWDGSRGLSGSVQAFYIRLIEPLDGSFKMASGIWTELYEPGTMLHWARLDGNRIIVTWDGVTPRAISYDGPLIDGDLQGNVKFNISLSENDQIVNDTITSIKRAKSVPLGPTPPEDLIP